MTTYTLEGCNIKKIMESGQCFRIYHIKDNIYHVLSGDRLCIAKQQGDDTVISCLEMDLSYWLHYFDESNSFGYAWFRESALNDDCKFIQDAVSFCQGLRLLKQDFFECFISFIISQRKNIPAIRSSIEKLCKKYGKKSVCCGVTYHAFPTPLELFEGGVEDRYADCGLGYREDFIFGVCKFLIENEDFDAEGLTCGFCEYEDALVYLKSFRGVGDKVANCTMLYSLGYVDAFPVDVWVSRVLNKHLDYEDVCSMNDRYRGNLGLLQLYLFYYVRSLKGVIR